MTEPMTPEDIASIFENLLLAAGRLNENKPVRNLDEVFSSAKLVLAAYRASQNEPDDLLHRAFIVLKALDRSVEWELAPPIMEEIRKLCREFEARASLGEGVEGQK